MKILLTGASGMVGRNIINHEFAKTYEWLTPPRVQLDLLSYQSTFDFLFDTKPDLIIHAAGKVGGIQANLLEPSSFLVENLDIGRNLVMAASKVGIPRVLNLGSTCMYPKDRDEPLTESDLLTGPLEPTNEGYALAKIMIWKLCDYLTRENSNLSYKTLVPCNLYGPYDNFDPVRSHLIPAIIRKLHEAKTSNHASVEVWGTGTARREFLYVEDLVGAIFRAIEAFDTLPDITNIGLGFDYSVNEYYQIAAQIIGYNGNFHHSVDKPIGMTRKLSNTKLAREWGWTPKHSIEDGLTKTYEFYVKRLLKLST